MTETLKNKIGEGLLIAAAVVGVYFVSNWMNSMHNTKHVVTKGYQLESVSNGMDGHTEFIRYKDGSCDIKIIPKKESYDDTQYYQDLDGDGLIDRIRRSSNFTTTNRRLTELLIRKHDYSSKKSDFDKADNTLSKLMDKYPNMK